MAIIKFENSFRGKGDKFYASVCDVDTIEEVKQVTKEFKAQKKKFLFQVQDSGGWRIFLEKKVELTPEQIEFLKQSNLIEKEPSDIALTDSMIALSYALENKENITLEYIIKIHELIMRRLNRRIAGKWRACAVSIGGRTCSNEGKYFLRKEVTEWLDSCIPSKLGGEEDTKRWHVAFEKIHPFEDGNGRTGRILMNIQRIKLGLPLLIIKEKEKEKYYDWFHEEYVVFACSKCGALGKGKYCDNCYNSTTCQSCGRRSYGKPFCFKCYSRAGRRR